MGGHDDGIRKLRIAHSAGVATLPSYAAEQGTTVLRSEEVVVVVVVQ